MPASLLRPRTGLPKDKFSAYFGPLKSQAYNDNPVGSRGGGGGPHSIRSIAWNPIGSLVASSSYDKTLRVWNPEKPNVRFSTELKGHTAPIGNIAFNPVKDAELCSIHSDGSVKIWDVRTKNCVNEVKGLGHCNALAWAPDGSSLLVGNRGREIFHISPSQSAVISTHRQPVETYQMAFCWGGDKVYVPTKEGRIRILTFPEMEPLYHVNHAVKEGESTEFSLKGHTSACLTVELSPTNKYLATGGSDAVISLFDTTDLICQRTITRPAGPVQNISFTWDGSYLVGGCDEGSGLDVSHTETGELVHTFKTAGPSEAVAWAPQRYCLAYGDLGMLRIVGVDTDRK